MATSSRDPVGAATAAQGLHGRLRRFLYSDKHLAGCVGGVVGLALFFTGMVDDLWPLVVGGLYGAGALAWPPAKAVDLHLGVDLDDLDATMRDQAAQLTGKLPREALAAVGRIHRTVREIVDRQDRLPPGSPDVFTVRQTVADYLPGVLEPYLRLPRRYADHASLADGRTAKGVLLDQLAVLETELDAVLAGVIRGDTDQLLAHERFLADRFGGSGLSLPAQDTDRGPDGGGRPDGQPTP